MASFRDFIEKYVFTYPCDKLELEGEGGRIERGMMVGSRTRVPSVPPWFLRLDRLFEERNRGQFLESIFAPIFSSLLSLFFPSDRPMDRSKGGHGLNELVVEGGRQGGGEGIYARRCAAHESHKVGPH